VGSIPGPPCQQFFNPGLQKKINKALSVRVIVICSDHKHLWRDSYKGVGHTSTLLESILHKIIIIIIKYKSQLQVIRVAQQTIFFQVFSYLIIIQVFSKPVEGNLFKGHPCPVTDIFPSNPAKRLVHYFGVVESSVLVKMTFNPFSNVGRLLWFFTFDY